MALPPWREQPVSKHHDRNAFDCGDASLNLFLRNHARQSHERGAAKTFVAADAADEARVLGFYSLSPASLDYERAPEAVRRGLGRYDIGAYRLGRLAVSVGVQGQGLGGQLLLAAGRRCLRAAQEAGGTLLLVDAKNVQAAALYAGYGAVPLPDAPLSLVLPLSVLARALTDAGKL